MSRPVALLTGASSGIGEAAAYELSARGYALVLAARREERLHRLARELDPSGSRIIAVPCDVADPAAREALVAAALDHFGRIDVLVNNAGVGLGGGVWWQDPDWARVLRVNLEAVMALTALVLPPMLERRRGHIVNVASVAGQVATEGVYSASKFGVRGFSFALRRELWGSGVEVSAVSPGFVRTEMTARSRLRMPGPEVVARAIADVLERPRREVTVPRLYRLAALAEALPALSDPLIARAYSARRRR
ncbi:short-chain dehydrogenase [Deinococcus piscis]|uniref:Short-chain dehydrogenase n=1 Tax=Deinococcus piscis TaxID=394230 RepID=A0ABQ3JYQ1_9DEIO|nr:SDR family NAD(P)-dependent oxidoreductase [Deinococcus piscis]GHF92569.1 short-chain dehydrogenase [Deinococcus piscis]